MSSHNPRIAQGVALALAVGLTGVALFGLVSGEPEEVEVELGEDGRPLTERQVAQRDRDAMVRAARNEMAGYGMMIRAFEGAGPGFYGNGELEIDEARRLFDGVMDEVDLLSQRRRRLRQRQWREVYRAANDSFTALSMHLDATDRTQAKELEEAHQRLRQGLAALRVRGKKFKVDLRTR